MGEGLSEQRTKARELLKRAIHRAPLIDEQIPTRQGLQIFFTHIHTEQHRFSPFLYNKKDRETLKREKTPLPLRYSILFGWVMRACELACLVE